MEGRHMSITAITVQKKKKNTPNALLTCVTANALRKGKLCSMKLIVVSNVVQ